MVAPLGLLWNAWRKGYMRTTQENCMLFWTQPGSSTLQTADVCLLTSYLTNHPSKMNKTCWRSKNKLIIDILLWTPTHGHTSVGHPEKTNIYQLCADTGCSQDDLLWVMIPCFQYDLIMTTQRQQYLKVEISASCNGLIQISIPLCCARNVIIYT